MCNAQNNFDLLNYRIVIPGVFLSNIENNVLATYVPF